MKLFKLKIEGFKRIKTAEIFFGDATFLIGSNNSGKSSVLNAIEYLLSGKKTILSSEYYSIIYEDTGETKPAVSTIVFEAEFRNLPGEIGSQKQENFFVNTYQLKNINKTLRQ